jgi:hypothetical protein
MSIVHAVRISPSQHNPVFSAEAFIPTVQPTTLVIVRALLGRRATSIIDLHRGGYARRKDDARRYIVDMDANWDALGNAYLGEDGIDGSKPLIVGLMNPRVAAGHRRDRSR